MREASKRLEFEYAAVLRDRIIELRGEVDGAASRKRSRLENWNYSSEADCLRIWQYIDSNPLKWREDCYYVPA